MFMPLFLIANDCNYVMDDYQMEKIIESMNNQKDETKQLNTIKMYLQRLCINTDQLVSIMTVFKSENIQNDFFIYAENYMTNVEEYKKLKIKKFKD